MDEDARKPTCSNHIELKPYVFIYPFLADVTAKVANPHIKTHDVCNLPMWCKTVVDSRSSMSGICTRICIFNYKANIYPKNHQRLPTYITQIVYSHTIYSRNISIIHICQYSHWLCLKMRYPKTVCLWFETLFTIVLFHHYEHVLPIWRFPKIGLPQSSSIEKKHEINHPFMEFPIYH